MATRKGGLRVFTRSAAARLLQPTETLDPGRRPADRGEADARRDPAAL